MLEENLLSTQGGAGVGVGAVGAFQPVSLGGGGAAGDASGQPGVGPPLPAGPWSCGCCSCHLRCWCATVPTAAATTTTNTTTTTTSNTSNTATVTMDGERQRLGVVVVLLRGLRTRCAWAALLPQAQVLLGDPVQLALQLLDAPPLGVQELGLALDDVVELQEVLHCPVGALRAGLHGGSPASEGMASAASQRHSFDPRGA